MWRHVRHVIGTLAVVVFTLLLGTMAAVAQDIDIDDQTGRLGEEVTFTVSINNAPDGVDAFGFEITFDANILSFDATDADGDLVADAATPGPLVEGWTLFGVSSPAPGRIRVGGSTIPNSITAGTSGVLVQLTFTVVGDGDPSSTTLAIVMPSDDIDTWTLGQGEFTVDVSPPLEVTAGAQSPPANITVTTAATNLPVLQLQLDSDTDTVTINTVTVNFSDFTGDASTLTLLRVMAVNDTNGNGAVNNGEPVLANETIDPGTASVTLTVNPALVLPPDSTVNLLIALNVSTVRSASLSPQTPMPWRRFAWLMILPPALGMVLCARRRRPAWLLLGVLIFTLGCSVVLTGCSSGGGSDDDEQQQFAFAVGIPANGVAAQGAAFGPFSAPAAPIAGPTLTVSP